MLYDVSIDRGSLKYEPSKTPISLNQKTLESAHDMLIKINSHFFENQEDLQNAKQLTVKLLKDFEQVAITAKAKKIGNSFFHHDQTIASSLNSLVELADNIAQRKVLSKEEYIQQAKNDARDDPVTFLTVGRHYGITDEKPFIEMVDTAVFALRYNPEAICKHLKELKILNAEDRMHIMKIILYGRQTYYLTKNLEYLIDFAKNDKKILKEIVLALKEDIKIKDFTKILLLLDEPTKFELALDLSKSYPLFFYQNFASFSFNKDVKEKIIYEILKGGWVDRLVKNMAVFGKLRDQVKQDIQIAHELEINPAKLAENIDRYQLTPARRLEIAEKIAVNDGKALCQFIQKFKIKGEDDLIRLAEIALCNFFQQINTGMEFFPNFGIKDPQKLINLAKRLIKSNPEIAKYIHFFTNDKKTQLDIAMIGAKSGIEGLAPYLKGLTNDSKKLFEIAKEAVKFNAEYFLKEYALLFDDVKTRIELVKSCNPDQGEFILSGNLLKDLGLSLNQQIKMVTHFSAFHPLKVLEFLSNKKISNQKDLILKCINQAKKHEPGSLVLCLLDQNQFLLNFVSESKLDRTELIVNLLKKEANRAPEDMVFLLDKIWEPQSDLQIEDRLDIFLEVYKNDPESAEKIKRFVDPKFLEEFSLSLPINQPPDIKKYQNFLHEGDITDFDPIFDQLKAMDQVKEHKQINEALQWIYFTASKFPRNYEQDNAEIWKTIFKYRQPNMRYNLSDQAIRLITSKENHLDTYKATAETEHLKLPALYLVQNEAFKSVLQKIHKEKRAEFKDVSLMHLFISTLHLLFNSSLPAKRQAAILEDLLKLDKKKMKVELLNLTGILETGYEEKLQENKNQSYRLILEKISQEILISLVPKLQPKLSFSQKFSDTFGKNINVVAALTTYAARMQQLQGNEKKEVLEILGSFIQEVMNGKFKSERYNENHSPHLKAIFERVKGLKEAWSKTVEVPLSYNNAKLEEEFNGWKFVRSDDFADLFMCGTVVKGSCQNVNGTVGLNKALLAYPMEGKNQLIAIKDLEGNIICRSIFRILIDKKTDLPVLFQERFYTNHMDNRLNKLLDQFAEDQAKALKLPLFRGVNVGGDGTLESLGGRSPFEYVDAVRGVCEECKFSFGNATQVKI